MTLSVDPAVKARFPDYHGLVVVARNVTNAPSDHRSAALLLGAEAHARSTFAGIKAADHPHLAAWREAFRAFGVSPKKMVCSAEALITRVVKGGDLPRINQIVDAYNAVSVKHVVPTGGENLDAVVGTVRLFFADGSEPFESMKNGEPFTDHPSPGEVVWGDELGATCRAWNWRQCVRTRLEESTQNAYFLFDALGPMTREQLHAAADELCEHLQALSPGCELSRFEI